MTHDTVFGALAARFSSSPENLATEALAFVLRNTPAARASFIRFLRHLGTRVEGDLAFSTQSTGEAGEIPDLVGTDRDGAQVLVGEAKFWAGLTDNQPSAYIERLPTDRECLLLFIAPEQRLERLWIEIVRRVRMAGHEVEEVPDLTPGLFRASLGGMRSVGLCSWRSLTVRLEADLSTEGELHAASNVRQLAGLCEAMDSEAFIPLRSVELTGSTGRRIQDYCSLVDDVTTHLAEEGLASLEGVRATSSRGSYGRYMRLKGVPCMLELSASAWSSWAATPLWLQVKGMDWSYSEHVRQALHEFEVASPKELFWNDRAVYVPVFLPVGREKQEVMGSIIQTIHRVATALDLAGLTKNISDDAADTGPPELSDSVD